MGTLTYLDSHRRESERRQIILRGARENVTITIAKRKCTFFFWRFAYEVIVHRWRFNCALERTAVYVFSSAAFAAQTIDEITAETRKRGGLVDFLNHTGEPDECFFKRGGFPSRPSPTLPSAA